MEFRVEKRHCF